MSLDYSGYSLATSQQLVAKYGEPSVVGYTLPDFWQYLILQRSSSRGGVVGSRRAEVIVLVPVGDVACVRSDLYDDDHELRSGCAAVRVVTNTSSSAPQKVRRGDWFSSFA